MEPASQQKPTTAQEQRNWGGHNTKGYVNKYTVVYINKDSHSPTLSFASFHAREGGKYLMEALRPLCRVAIKDCRLKITRGINKDVHVKKTN